METWLLHYERELRRERRDLKRSERAGIEGRVTDKPLWERTLQARRERIARLEQQLDEMRKEEEAAA